VDGRAARWQGHNQERRRRVVEAAIAMVEEGVGELSLQDVGVRAGLSRSVVYRLFADRRELDAAVQREVLAGIMDELLAAMVLEETLRATMRRVIGVYVDWAASHPRLHRVADYDTAVDGNGPLQQVVGQIATSAVELLEAIVDRLRVERTKPPRDITLPFAHGMVGMVFGTVRSWVHQQVGGTDADLLVSLLTDAVWAQVDVLLRTVGIEVDADRPLREWLILG
jgi:AcrR family transcriptional regulator